MDSPTELITLIAVGIGLMLLLALAFVLFFYFSQNKLRQEQFKVQAARLEYQEKLLHSTILTQEEERERIAKDLHDEVGSKLNVVHLYLHQLSRKAPDAGETIGELLSVINDTIHTTRRISHDLLPPTLESFGLAVAIDELIDQLQPAHPDLQLHLETEGERPAGIEKVVELNLFRILHELLSNTLKYAAAKEVHIHLRQYPDQLWLQYRDDGKGFDPAILTQRKGLGMQNIQSRLQMMGGHYTLDSAPGKGIKVQIEVKIPEATEKETVRSVIS
ncbi:MAG: ATP-binding protein [Bacteroidota bacterium]